MGDRHAGVACVGDAGRRHRRALGRVTGKRLRVVERQVRGRVSARRPDDIRGAALAAVRGLRQGQFSMRSLAAHGIGQRARGAAPRAAVAAIPAAVAARLYHRRRGRGRPLRIGGGAARRARRAARAVNHAAAGGEGLCVSRISAERLHAGDARHAAADAGYGGRHIAAGAARTAQGVEAVGSIRVDDAHDASQNCADASGARRGER